MPLNLASPHPLRSLRMYNSLVERCFKDCVESFRRKDLDATEEKVRGRLLHAVRRARVAARPRRTGGEARRTRGSAGANAGLQRWACICVSTGAGSSPCSPALCVKNGERPAAAFQVALPS